MLKALWVFQLLLVVCLGSRVDKSVKSSIIKDGRIAGGNEALRNQFPYQVVIFITSTTGEQSLCGGSVLSANFVLTAAHCLVAFEYAEILAGVFDIFNEYPTYEHEIVPSEVILHASYNRATNLNDIALARTSRKPIPFGTTIQPMPLVPRSFANTDLTGVTGRVGGWGRTSDTGNAETARLRYIEAPIISNSVCQLTFGSVITTSNICLSGANRRSTCPGDSGGPLTILHSGRQVQVGIVSFGSENGCQLGYPTAFARITSFHSWIQTNTGITIP